MSQQSLLLLSGPNLNLLGEREPLIYGTSTLEDLVQLATQKAGELKRKLEHFQSNHEGELIEAIHGARGKHDAIIINAGAFSHYSWGLHDALQVFEGVVVELHISNPCARESWRHTSVITPVADGVISGFGSHGYELAVEATCALLP